MSDEGDDDIDILQTNTSGPILVSSQKNLRVFQIKLMLNTNLPGTTDPIPFQFDMLYHPDLEKGKFSGSKYTLPYFTDTVKYPMDMLSAKLYSDRVNFFFSKTRFNKILRKTMVDYVDIMGTSNNSTDATQNDEQRGTQLQENADHNIKCMLILLFPIADEMHNVFKTTYDQYILDNMSPEILTIRNIDPITFLNPSRFPLYNYFTQRKYEAPMTEVSYLKHNNGKYIITDVIWQNDLINHPVYRKFVSIYHDKLREKRNNSRKINGQYEERKKLLVSLIGKQKNVFGRMIKSLIENVSGSHYPRIQNLKYEFDDRTVDTKYNQKENTKRDIIVKMINYIGSIDDILKGYRGKLDSFYNGGKLMIPIYDDNTPPTITTRIQIDRSDKVVYTPKPIDDISKLNDSSPKMVRALHIIIDNIVNTYIDYTNYNKDADSAMKITLKDNTRVLTELYNTAITLKTVDLLRKFINDQIRRLDLSETNDDGSSKTKMELDILRVLNQNYKYYVDLNIAISSSLKNVIEPARRSSNPTLQAFLKQFAIPTTNKVDDQNMLIDIYDKYISSVRTYVKPEYIKKYMNVGVSTIVHSDSESKSKSSFTGEMPEIYVYINVVNKETYETAETRDCVMSDDRLTNNLKQILYSNTMLDHSFPETNIYRAYELSGNPAKILVPDAEKPSGTKNPSLQKSFDDVNPKDAKPLKGGKRQTRKRQPRKRKTRKHSYSRIDTP